MPKQVGLDISLRNSLRSKEFVMHLDNMGNSICYDEVLRNETTWISDILKKGDGFATLHTNLSKSFFTQRAFKKRIYCNTSQTLCYTSMIILVR